MADRTKSRFPVIDSRTKMATIFVGLALFVGAVFGASYVHWRGVGLLDPQDAHRRAVLKSSSLKIADRLILAASALAEERGLTYAALQGAAPFGADARSKLNDLRRASNASLDEAVRLIRTGTQIPTQVRFMTRLVDSQALVNELRQQVDAWEPSQSSVQTIVLTRRWFQAATRQLAATEEALNAAHATIRTAGITPDIDVLLRLQRLAIVINDSVGRERAMVTAMLARKQPLSDEEAYWGRASEDRVGHLWQQTKAQMVAQDLNPDVMQAMDSVARIYFIEMKAARRAVHDARIANVPYPVTPEQWFKKSTDAIAQMNRIGRTAGDIALSKLPGV